MGRQGNVGERAVEQSSGSQTGRHGPVGATSWHHCHPARIPCVSSTPSLRSTHSCVRLVRVFGLGFDLWKPGTAAGALDASFETHARIEIFSLPTDVAESGAAAPALEPIVSLAVPARVHRLAWTGRGAYRSMCFTAVCWTPLTLESVPSAGADGREGTMGVLAAGLENGVVEVYDARGLLTGTVSFSAFRFPPDVCHADTREGPDTRLRTQASARETRAASRAWRHTAPRSRASTSTRTWTASSRPVRNTRACLCALPS